MDNETWSEEELLAHLPASIVGEERELVCRAYRLAAECHDGQTRDEGTPYLRHPVGVFCILVQDVGVDDPEVLAASLLHDVIEDSPLTTADLEQRFPARVARMVAVLSKDKRPGAGKDARDRAYLEGVARAGLPVRLIKVADRLDNAGRLHLSPSAAKQRRYWAETREHYLPLAQATHPELCRRMREWVEAFGARLAAEEGS